MKKENDEIVIKTETYRETIDFLKKHSLDIGSDGSYVAAHRKRKIDQNKGEESQNEWGSNSYHEVTLIGSPRNNMQIMSANISPRNSFLKKQESDAKKMQRYSSIEDLWSGTVSTPKVASAKKEK